MNLKMYNETLKKKPTLALAPNNYGGLKPWRLATLPKSRIAIELHFTQSSRQKMKTVNFLTTQVH